MLDLVRRTWGLAPRAEVTTEANPETVDERYLATCATRRVTVVRFMPWKSLSIYVIAL